MKENIMSDMFFYAIPISLIVLLIGLSFSIFEIIITAGFLLFLLLMTLTIFAANDLDWIKDRPVRPAPKQIINFFMQHPPRRYAAVSYDEYEEEDDELEEDDDPFADLDIIDNHGFLD